MSKYARGRYRKTRVWKRNVGDGGALSKEGKNPNDSLSRKGGK